MIDLQHIMERICAIEDRLNRREQSGPEPEKTNRILDILRSYEAKLTIHVVVPEKAFVALNKVHPATMSEKNLEPKIDVDCGDVVVSFRRDKAGEGSEKP